ncbi:MAG: hypothetical protein KC589_10345 [Nanoarchaeota archaeon]|nr:hypothetical protein [Nanoarchaeota archaeon]
MNKITLITSSKILGLLIMRRDNNYYWTYYNNFDDFTDLESWEEISMELYEQLDSQSFINGIDDL